VISNGDRKARTIDGRGGSRTGEKAGVQDGPNKNGLETTAISERNFDAVKHHNQSVFGKEVIPISSGIIRSRRTVASDSFGRIHGSEPLCRESVDYRMIPVDVESYDP
jgi:hypothetical protein